ncbi:hypothetical protein [Sinomonas flava]|uniref:hypothetical protein n=1 Tax=Sinomonas flava TaxID=496857 RepID=UPI0031D0F4A0
MAPIVLTGAATETAAAAAAAPDWQGAGTNSKQAQVNDEMLPKGALAKGYIIRFGDSSARRWTWTNFFAGLAGILMGDTS